MAVIQSNFSLQTGIRLLGEILSERIGRDEIHNVADRNAWYYLISKAVAEQYPTHVYGGDPNAGFESLAGRLMNRRG